MTGALQEYLRGVYWYRLPAGVYGVRVDGDTLHCLVIAHWRFLSRRT